MKINSPHHRRSATATTTGTGVLIGFSCLVCVTFISLFVVYLSSSMGDLKRELAETKIALLDVTENNKKADDYNLRGHDVGSRALELETDQINDGDANDFDIIREMDQYMNRERLKKLAQQHKQTYAQNQPFPSHVFDDIFPKRILRKIAQEHPESALDSNGCLPGPTNEGCRSGKTKGQKHKSKIDNDKNMGIFTKLFMGYLKSSAFLNFLVVLSGIEGMVPDPHYFGSGLHFTASGGKLDIHADFNALIKHKLERRVNLLLFLNDDWDPEYGGHLELWSRDMNQCSAKIAPRLGRMVVFSTTDFTYHGHPHELTAPTGRARRSIAMYYYTTQRPKAECRDEKCAFMSDFTQWHSTMFQEPKCGTDCEDDLCNDLPVPNPYAQ